ncbi:hypothetical protein [Caldisericum sp.]
MKVGGGSRGVAFGKTFWLVGLSGYTEIKKGYNSARITKRLSREIVGIG